jgi:hypothetical protein
VKDNEILGPISTREDAEIQECIGGTHDNRLFSFFGIHAGDRVFTVGRRAVQAKCAAKKGDQGSSEAASPSVRQKTLRKCCGRGIGRNVSKRQRTSRAVTSEVVSSSHEESGDAIGEDQNAETHPAEGGTGSGTNLDAPSANQIEEIDDIASLYPGPSAGAMLADPLNISYSKPKLKNDEDCALHTRSVKDMSPIPQPQTIEALLPSAGDFTSSSEVISAIHQRFLARTAQSDGSSSDTESDTHSGGVFVNSESPSVVAKRLGRKPNSRIFGDSMCKVLQFYSDDCEHTLLQEAGDSFGFPIIEDELGKESAEDILYHAQDSSMKSFLACRAAQHR